MPLRETRLQAIMWMCFLAALGLFIAGQAILAALAAVAAFAIGFSTQGEVEKRASGASRSEEVASN